VHLGRWAGDLGSVLRARVVRRRGALPQFLIIGTKRGGSTSAYHWITRHPLVAPSRAKKGSHYFDVHHGRGWDWFRSSFPVIPDGMITGEASPYYMFHPMAPRWIARELPEVRLIALLRDPVTRAHSHYRYNVRRGYEPLDFDDALDQEGSRLAGELGRMLSDHNYVSFAHRHHTYLARGRYWEQLERVFEWISPERVLILRSEALFADPVGQLARVWEFLGLPPHSLTDLPTYKQGNREAIAKGARDRLVDYFRPHNERLYALPGIDFRWPSGIAWDAGHGLGAARSDETRLDASRGS
jgi:hypothetical protein